VPVLRANTADQPLGVIYTPPEVATAMVRVALEPLLRDRTVDELAALRICDFATGEGVFLEAAIAAISEALARAGSGEPERSAARCVVGVDVDARAIATARHRLGCSPDALQVGNALELDWPGAFPDAFARGGFDAVVGNPPYIRQEQLTRKQALRGFASYDGVADLYVYFLELAHRLVRPGGRYCVITPNKWLTVDYARRLRGFLAAEGSVDGIVDLGRMPLFAEADAFPCIVWGTVGVSRQTPVVTGRARSGAVAAALADPGGTTVRAELGAEPWHLDAPPERALIERLEQRWPALGDLLDQRPARGVVTGCNRAFVIDRETRTRLLELDPGSDALIRPFVKGRDIRPWVAAPTERWILLIDRGTSIEDRPAIATHLARFRDALEPRPAGHRGAWSGRKPGTYRWFELQDPVGELAASRAPRLLYQDIQTGPACALDRSGLVPDTTVWILPSADRVLLAILNSSLYGWYARRRFPPALNGSVRPKLAYMRGLPIATPGLAARDALERLVDVQLTAGDPAAAAAIDRAVLDLYELTPAEREIVSGAGVSGAGVSGAG